LGRAFEKVITEVDADNTNWSLPVICLVEELKKEGLLKYARSDICNEDDLQIVLRLVTQNVTLPNDYYALHLCNEWIAKNGVNKNSIPINSTIGRLMARNRVGAWLPGKLTRLLFQLTRKMRLFNN
jgi:hypothetical protein